MPGSFVTHDTQTKTLFSSDMFGSFDNQWTLFLELNDNCRSCQDSRICSQNASVCPIKGIIKFHQNTMTSNLAMANALNVIESLDIDRIARQHGSIISSEDDIKAIIMHLRGVKNIGIDYFLLLQNILTSIPDEQKYYLLKVYSLEIIISGKGSHFDPELVDILIRTQEEFKILYNSIK